MATILVVDDRPTNRHYLVSLLGYAGHRLLEAEDGEEALQLVRSERPDLVISDILMPSMDGYEFVRALRADPDIARTEVLFYTATYLASDARRLAADCGVATVLAKPAEPQLILDSVNRALAIPAPAPLPAALVSSAGAAAEEKALAGIGGTIREYLNDLQAVKELIDRVGAHGTGALREREVLKTGTERLSQNLVRLHATVGRLYALLDMTLDLIAEREPERMLHRFCAAARRIVGADCAAAGILAGDEHTLRHFIAAGMDSGAPVAGESLLAAGGLLRRAMDEGAVRVTAPEGAAGVDGLPPGHPPAESFLGVRVMSATRTYGVLYFTGKSGAPAFGVEDQQIAFTLAAELGMLYENLDLYEMIQRHAVELQLEAARRKEAEEKVLRLNRVYAVLSSINAAIVRIRDREALFQEACRLAVEEGGFGIAWIGVFDAATLEVTPVAWAGVDADVVAAAKSTARADVPQGQGNIGRAIRERRPVCSNDISKDGNVGGPRRQEALRRGYRSLIALPLLAGTEVRGTLALFAREAGFFDDAEMKLLAEVAGDISFALEMIDKEARLDYLAYYDVLTGLPNRSLLHDRLEQQMRMARREQSMTALVLFDVSRFKMVNDSLGRRAGDVLLKETAARLRNAAREPSTVARLGADRFAITLPGLRQAADAGGFVERALAECFRKPFVLDAEELRVSAVAGIAVSPEDAGDADGLMQHAETALKGAKERGAQYVFYAPEMNARVAESLRLETRLRRALENDELALHYQPKVDIHSRAITGLEALMRWNDPESGLVPPARFIPLMERTGLIVEAGQWAIRQALADHARWRSQGLKVPRIAVNVSALQLRQQDFAQRTAEAIAQSGAGAAALELEITESVVMENVEASVPVLKALRDTGVQIAVDDFGTGYSSLAYVARLPVHALKIDRAFIRDLMSGPDSVAVVKSMISLAHSLGLKVVAEGVETEEQAKLLGLLQCDEMQGYLFSPPVPPPQVEGFLK